jgi:rhodanese-related sulfurtransferase
VSFARLFWWLPFGRVPEIDAAALRAMLQADPTTQLLDVRTVSEWHHSHIAGTMNVPVTELKAALPALALDRKRPVVALCRSARRSIPAVRLLKAHGFEQVCQLQGGMRAWWGAGLPVEGATGE